MPASPNRQRLFFALWPHADVRAAMAAMRDDCVASGRPVATDNLHLTLLFLGDLDAAARACMEAVADRIDTAAFTLALTAVDSWREAAVTCMTPNAIPTACAQLVASLRNGAEHCGLQCECRAFVSHITLGRNAQPMPRREIINPLIWPVTAFSLVESRLTSCGAAYTPLRSWNLK